ncbi:MAG: hypothetical protein KAH38_11660, partial [Candidatus Hydrogenedentes bacterium]|nr:hypothetical protein [Candidatus Hydrogenedentota bacterium]
AVAQVEAKALGNVDDHINPNRQEEEIQSNPIAPQEHEKSSPPTYPVETDLHNAPSLHVESDEKAIAEAMARVEEKARENISGEEPEKIQSPECDETLAHKQSKISTQESISHIKSESGLEQAHTQMDANAIATAMEQIEIKAQEKEKQKHCNDTPPPVELTQSPEKLQKEEDDKSSPSMHPSNDSTSNP